MSTSPTSPTDPDGTVVYKLATTVSGTPYRITSYDKNAVNGVVLTQTNGNVELEPGSNSTEDTIVVKDGTSGVAVYVSIQITDCNDTPLFPFGVLIRPKKSNEGDDDPDATFPNIYISADGRTMTLEDNVDGPANFDFDVIFSTETNSTGDMGWLDPKLDNTQQD